MVTGERSGVPTYSTGIAAGTIGRTRYIRNVENVPYWPPQNAVSLCVVVVVVVAVECIRHILMITY